MSLYPSEHNIVIEQGRDYVQTYTIQDNNGVEIDLTGYTAYAQIRPTYISDDLIADFDITISGTAGEVTLTLSDVTTSGIELESAVNASTRVSSLNAVWDLMMIDTLGIKYNYIKGTATIEGTATQA